MFQAFRCAPGLFPVFSLVFSLFSAVGAHAETLDYIFSSNGVPLELTHSTDRSVSRVKLRVAGHDVKSTDFHRLNAVLGPVTSQNKGPHTPLVPTIPNSFFEQLSALEATESQFTLVHANENVYAVNQRGEWIAIDRVAEKVVQWGIHRVFIPYGDKVKVPGKSVEKNLSMAEVIFIQTQTGREKMEVKIYVLPYLDREKVLSQALPSGPMKFDSKLLGFQTGSRFGWHSEGSADAFVLDVTESRWGNWITDERDDAPRNPSFVPVLPTVRRTVMPATETVTPPVQGAVTAALPARLLPGPRIPAPLFSNEAYIQRLSFFEAEYNKIVIGQTQVASRISQALEAHLGNPELKGKPFSVVLVGAKQTGKTMTGKAMAQILYGDEKKSVKIALSGIQSEYDMRTLFNPAKGMMGSETPGLLEQAVERLQDKDGVARGVLVFDEFSDVGTTGQNSRKLKPALLKMFDEIIEDGRFFSTVKNEYIDVSQLNFIFTGNDLASLFDGVTSEKAKMRRHAENADRKNVEKQLESSGVPGPFLRRVDDLILVEPMSRAKAKRISLETLLPSFREAFYRQYSMKVTFGPDESEFASILANDYFGSDDGVSGIKDLIQKRIGALAARALLTHRAELNKTADREIQFQWNSVTEMQVKVRLASGDQTYTRDFSTYRTPRPLLESDTNDPFDDERLAERIDGLSPALQERVFGQNEILDALAEMIRAKVYDPSGEQRPQAAFIVGGTGTGKTETAKALAQTIYGAKESDKHLAVIAMGEYHDKAEFNKFLGAAPGYIGSDRQSDFETAILKLQAAGGGIMVLDEFSNVGGGDLELKKTMCKLLYSIKEEGKWTSPLSGTTYDLSSIFFLLTGNDAEELFQGAFAYSDDMRQRIWEDHSQRDELEKMLIQKGLTSAFLGRLDGVFLQRPQGMKALISIVEKKFLTPALNAYRATNPGLEFEYDDQFITHFTEVFFAYGGGARSLRRVVDQSLKGIVTDALLDARKRKIEKGAPMKVRLRLQDNWKGLIFREASTPEKRAVYLEGSLISLQGGGELKTFTRDVSAVTPARPLYNKLFTEKTAYHEAGHAVANISDWTGDRLRYITIQGGGRIMGYASYERIPGTAFQDRNSAVGDVARLMAGQLAEMMLGHAKEGGWSNDLKVMRETASKAFITWGLVPELVGVRTNKEGEPIFTPGQSLVFKREFGRLLRDAYKLAQDRLTKNWAQVEKVQELLMKYGFVTQDQFNAIMATSVEVTGIRMTPVKEPVFIPMETLIPVPKKKTCAHLLQTEVKADAA